MWQSFGASKAPVQMRMSPSWRQIDRQNHKGREDRQTYIDEKNEKREKKSKRAIEKKKKKRRTPCFRNNDFPADRK